MAMTGRHLDERIVAAESDVAEAQARLEETKREAHQAHTYLSENRFSALIADSLGIRHPHRDEH